MAPLGQRKCCPPPPRAAVFQRTYRVKRALVADPASKHVKTLTETRKSDLLQGSDATNAAHVNAATIQERTLNDSKRTQHYNTVTFLKYIPRIINNF